MRRRFSEGVSRALWSALAAVGLPRERWLAWPRLRRRTIKAVLWLGLALILIWRLGVWKVSALSAGARLALRGGPLYPRMKFRGRRIGKWVLSAAALATAIAHPYFPIPKPL